VRKPVGICIALYRKRNAVGGERNGSVRDERVAVGVVNRRVRRVFWQRYVGVRRTSEGKCTGTRNAVLGRAGAKSSNPNAGSESARITVWRPVSSPQTRRTQEAETTRESAEPMR